MDKHEVMKEAQRYHAEGLSLQDAVTRAWCEAKIADLENHRFWDIEVKDTLTTADNKAILQITVQEAALRRRIVLTPGELAALNKEREAARLERERREEEALQNSMRQQAAWSEYQSRKFAAMFPALYANS